MWQRFTEEAKRAIYWAQEEARSRGTRYVGAEHVAIALLRPDMPTVAAILQRLRADRARIAAAIGALIAGTLQPDPPPVTDMELTRTSKRAIDLAFEEARSLWDNHIGEEHLFLGCLRACQQNRSLLRRRIEEEARFLARLLTPFAQEGVTLDSARRELRRFRAEAGMLLRASTNPDGPESVLLRPAQGRADPESDALLRPVEQDPR